MLMDEFEFTQYFRDDSRQQEFFTQMLEYAIVSAVNISAKCHETYFPGLGEICDIFN